MEQSFASVKNNEIIQQLKTFQQFSCNQILGKNADKSLQRRFLKTLRKEAKDAGLETFHVPKDDNKLKEKVEWAFIRYNTDNTEFYEFMRDDNSFSEGLNMSQKNETVCCLSY